MPPAPPSPYAACRLCPRECAVDRESGAAGICGQSAQLRLASFGLHMGEEPCFVGTQGSGTLFFSGCPCHCFFCQNWQISNADGNGRNIDAEELHAIAEDLIRQGAHNLNFVTPDPFWPHVEALCARLRREGHTLPFLLNTSGYHRPGQIPLYAQCIDIFLPDFKFADPALARAVLRDERYPQLALESLRLMVDANGFLDPFDPTGTDVARQGVLVRHLVLPGHLDNTLHALDLLRREFGRYLPLSLMSQYTPVPASRNRPPFDRPLAPAEYQAAVDHAQALGFENLLIQPLDADDAFLPDFDRPQPFRGNSVPWI
jgi:putative pyruvate formate lyase activating enzyme